MTDLFELQVLDPQETKFYRTGGGLLAMRTNDAEHPEVTLCRTFPFTYTDRYLSVRDPKGTEIGILEQLDELDEASRSAAETELRLRYLTPQVTRIEKIEQKPGMWFWQMQTTMGPMRLAMRNLHDHVMRPLPGKWMLSDIDGNRVEIADEEALDAHSRKQLSRLF